MAGGSFGNPQGAPLSAMQQSLFAQMDSMRRASVGVQDIFANRMMGASPYGAGGQMAGAAGDTMYRLNQTLEKLTNQVARSPLSTGQSIMGGAGVSAGQMLASGMFGGNVQVQGLPGGALGGQMGRMMFAENVELGLERMGRAGATQMLPAVAGAVASLMPMGAIAGPLAHFGAQLAAPMALRGTGADAALQHGQISRQFRTDIGDRMAGGSVAGRFLASYSAGNKLAGGMTDYIYNQQQNYQSGLLNFGLNAEEYAPLQSAMTGMMGGRDLKRLTEDGSKVIKEQMDALIGVSATLNMTFKETADLARQFGETEGGAAGLSQYVQTIEDAAQRGGIGMRRGMASQFGIGMRNQARQMGLQGEVSAGQAIQDVGVLQSMMNRTAGQRLLSYDQLAAFGGASEQERMQNMVQAMFNAGSTIAQGPVGAMIRGNILAGNTGMQGGMLGMMGTAGGAFARDPFGFVISQADPTVNQQVQNRALFTHMDMLQEAFGGLDPNAAAAAFISKAGSLGMTKTQAGAVQEFYQANQDTAQGIAKRYGVKSSRVFSAAMGLADKLGISQAEAMKKMEDGMTLVQAEGIVSGTFGFNKVGDPANMYSEGEITLLADAAGVAAGKDADFDERVRLADMKARGIDRRDGVGRFFGKSWEYTKQWLEFQTFGAPGRNEAITKASASERTKLLRERSLAQTSAEGRAYMRSNRAIFQRAGVGFTAEGELSANAFANFSMEDFNRGPEIGNMVRALATGTNFTEAAQELKKNDPTGFKALLSTIGALSSTEQGKKMVEEFGLIGVLGDSTLTEEEFTSGVTADKLALMMGMSDMKSGAASFLALNSLRPMVNSTTAMQSIMLRGNELLTEIRDKLPTD